MRKDILARLEYCIFEEDKDDECLEEKIEAIISRVFEDRNVGSMDGVDIQYSYVNIKNPDELCMARALVTGMA